MHTLILFFSLSSRNINVIANSIDVSARLSCFVKIYASLKLKLFVVLIGHHF